MQISRPTYPTIRVFVALALLLSVSAPLVHSVCADVETTEVSHDTEAHHTTGASFASCLYSDRGGVRDASCDELQRSVPECTVGVCTVEPENHVFALNTEKPSLRLDLPAHLIERISTEGIFSSPPVFRWSLENGDARLLVSVRLFTSTFLL